ncbi:MAG: aspartyl-tRNA synthetase, aspartyl-tRNA synthetase [Candidatus Parcubacteria bacterium]|jgi:aspartyl-tRNA synthetase
MNPRTLIKDLSEHVGKEVSFSGFVHARRDHGKIVFFDMRDETGHVQVVIPSKNEAVFASISEIRSEWVLTIKGLVKARPEKLVNPDEQNGSIEIEALDVQVLNKANTPPFDPTTDTSGINEETRLQYRYIDLRSDRMQKNMRMRSEWVRYCRDYLFGERFVEIETPLLTQSTPEGSRDFIIPSRHNPGNFYALPQSPQQYKQLLMASGFERYFQMARCVRDEDLRADRGYEFTQIDLEMAYVTKEDVMNAVEGMVTSAAEAMGKTIKEKPFPRITYKDAMAKYGADKFDMRTEEDKANGILAYAWVVDFPFFEKTDEGKWTFTHNPFSMPAPEHLEWHMKGEHLEDIITQQYDLVCNGFESGGGSIRAHQPEILKATYHNMGYSDAETEASVGHMLEAFAYGVPPHGGIALGVERNIMNLSGETYLREVQPFPMTGRGKTSIMNAPTPATPEQLKELGLSVVVKDTKKQGDKDTK